LTRRATGSKINDEVSKCDWRPIVDIYESKKAIIINAELPWVTKDSITLDVKENILTLKGVSRSAPVLS
jgi:HSP20 family protein